jgi:hypothetical protein
MPRGRAEAKIPPAEEPIDLTGEANVDGPVIDVDSGESKGETYFNSFQVTGDVVYGGRSDAIQGRYSVPHSKHGKWYTFVADYFQMAFHEDMSRARVLETVTKVVQQDFYVDGGTVEGAQITTVGRMTVFFHDQKDLELTATDDWRLRVGWFADSGSILNDDTLPSNDAAILANKPAKKFNNSIIGEDTRTNVFTMHEEYMYPIVVGRELVAICGYETSGDVSLIDQAMEWFDQI